MLEQLSDPFYQTLAIIGLFIIFFGLVSLFIKERLYLTESLVAVAIGIIFGPTCASIITPKEWFSEGTFYRIILEFSRIIISFQVMAVGLSIPGVYIKKHWRDIMMFLGPIMCLMWAVSSLAVWLFSELDVWTSLMIGACLAPTDPVLANAVIKGKFANRYIPSHLRNLLSIESGANDGLGFPFLMLPISLLLHSGAVGPALGEWFLVTWVYEITFSIIIGVAVGLLSKKALEASQKYKLIDNDSFLVYSMAVAMATTGLVALISSDDLLAVFIAGNVFSYDDDRYTQATKESHFQEVIDMLFNLIFFILLGSVFPWQEFVQLGLGRLLLIASAILLFRRLPFVMAFKPMIPQLRTGREAFFAGWFGPMGVGAIFFAMVCRHHTGLSQETSTSIFTVVSFVVLSSIVIHGITVPITHVHLKNRAKKKAARRKGFMGDTIPQMMHLGSSAILSNSIAHHHLNSASTLNPDANLGGMVERNGDNSSAIVDIVQPILRDIPEPRLVGDSRTDEHDDDPLEHHTMGRSHHLERNLVYGNTESRITSAPDVGAIPGSSGRRRVADSSGLPSLQSEALTTETEDLTTEDDSNLLYSHHRRNKRPPYRMRPVTTTDFEEGQYDYEEAYESESTTSATEHGEATIDGRTLRQEQILARLMQQKRDTSPQNPFIR